VRRCEAAGSNLAKFKESNVSEDPSAKKTHAPKTTHAEKGGGGKWLIGAAAAVLLAGAGYVGWQNFGPEQTSTGMAYNDQYASEPMRAGPIEADENLGLAESASDAAPPPAVETQTAAATPQRRTPARSTPAAEPIPEATIGITPASASVYDDDEIVVTARRPIWAQTPSARRLSAMYPQRALERGREGEARLACVVQDRGMLDCDQIEATPGGFGPAAERVARAYRHSTTLSDGGNAVGTPVNLRVVFRIEEEQARRAGRLRG